MGPGQYKFRPATTEKKPVSKGSSSSKFLLIVILLALPFLGFWFGTRHASAPGPDDNALVDTATSTNLGEEATTTDEAAGATAEIVSTPTKTTSATTPAAPKQTQTTKPAATAPTVLTAYVTAATNDTVSLDNIAIYEGDAAVKQMAADGLCDAAKPRTCTLDDGYYYRNTDPTLKTYPLSPNVYILTWTGGDYPLSKLKSHSPSTTPYSVTIDNTGKVIIIKEIYKQ
jgi:hypothetical protein